MALKSLVNDEAEMLGVDPDELELELELDPGLELELELELDDELPQAAAPTLAVTASTAKTALPFSKCTFNSPPPPYAHVRVARRLRATATCASHVGDLIRNHMYARVNEALTSIAPALMNGERNPRGARSDVTPQRTGTLPVGR